MKDNTLHSRQWALYNYLKTQTDWVTQNNTEIWRDVIGYEGLYQVSNFGRVKSLYKGRLLSLWQNKYGYLLANLRKGKVQKHKLVHCLVAEAFIEKPVVNSDKKLEVNHIDGVKTNNTVDNLEWVTRSENMKHAYRCGIATVTEKMRENFKSVGHRTGKINIEKINAKRKKAVCQLTVDGAIVAVYETISEARRATGIRHISECANHRLKTAGGYKWSFATNENMSKGAMI